MTATEIRCTARLAQAQLDRPHSDQPDMAVSQDWIDQLQSSVDATDTAISLRCIAAGAIFGLGFVIACAITAHFDQIKEILS